MTMATAKSWQSWIIGVLLMIVLGMSSWSWLTVDGRFNRAQQIHDRHSAALANMQTHVDRSEVLLEGISYDLAEMAKKQQGMADGERARYSIVRQELRVLQSKVDQLSERLGRLESGTRSGAVNDGGGLARGGG